MKGRRSNRIWFLALGVFVAMFLFSFLMNKYAKNDDKVDAANMGAFDAGYIISDYQMGNYDSMDERQIQNFLVSKGRCGNTNLSGVGTRVDYFSDSTPPTTWHVINGHTVCLAEEIINGESAAHIIWQAAHDYRINPQVLIVLLQKETGLITDPIPNSWDYQRATGYGCPDTAACSSKYYGLKNQIRNAAWLFRYTLDNGYSRYPIGNVYVQWNPNAGCGGSIVNIRNNATAALYRYTPYQPNAAALSSSYGHGDGCSAYGNRNFYSYFEDWFGDIKGDGLPIPDSSRVVEGEYVIKSALGNGMALDLAGGSGANGANVQLYNSNNTPAQKWQIKNNGDDTFSIINVGTGKVLDVNAGGTRDGSNVQSYQLNDSCAQKWKIVRDSAGLFSFYSTCSGRVLDVAGGVDYRGANVQIYRPNGSYAQKWVIVSGQNVLNGIYSIDSILTNNISLSAAINNGAMDGANVEITRGVQSAARKWRVTYGLDGYYTIIDFETGKALDAQNGGNNNGTNVQLYSENGTCAQKWRIIKRNNGVYAIYSACSGLALDVAGASINNGTNVQLYEHNGSAAQIWKFDLIDENIEDGSYIINSSLSKDKVLDVAGGNGMNGANIQLYSNNETIAQIWKIKKESDASYKVSSMINGSSLDVSGGSSINGSNIQLYQYNGTCAQKWQIIRNNDGTVSFYSRCSNKVLDVAGGNSVDSANVQLYSYNGSMAQRWMINAR